MTTGDPTAEPDIRTYGAAESEEDGRDRFAADLRELRISAGSPTLAALGHTTGVSKTVLSEAFSGRRLPSARTVAAIVTAFDGDVRTWVRRRDALDARSDDREPAPEGPDTATEDRPATLPPHAVVRRRTTVTLVAAAFVVGALLSGAVTGVLVARSDSGTVALPSASGSGSARDVAAVSGRSAAPTVAVENGTDPAETSCVDDAEVVASEVRARDTQLQVIYSAACHAAWSRITRYDDASAGNTVSTSIYRQIAPDASDRQSTTEPDAESAYTTLLVRPTPSTRLCATGSITVDGEHIDLGAPLCL